MEPYPLDSVGEPKLSMFIILSALHNMLQVFPLDAHQNVRLLWLGSSPFDSFQL